MSDFERTIEEIEEAEMERISQIEIEKIEKQEEKPFDRLSMEVISRRIDDIAENYRELNGSVKELIDKVNKPFELMMTRDNEWREFAKDMKSRLTAIEKNQCSSERRKKCEDEFNRKKEFKENFKKWTWAIVISTTVIFTAIFGEVGKAIFSFFRTLFKGHP